MYCWLPIVQHSYCQRVSLLRDIFLIKCWTLNIIRERKNKKVSTLIETLNRTRINKSITNFKMESNYVVALIRDGVIRPSENDSHVLTPCCPRPARKTTRRIFCLCRRRVNVRLVCGNAGRYCRYFCWGSRLPAGGMQWSDAAKLSQMTRVQSKTRCCFSRRITCCAPMDRTNIR